MNNKMTLKINIIDAFTDKPFKGNPAAVIITEQWLSDQIMQNIAIENNLSETAFAVKTADCSYHIRWFSPITEIDFCGHATLATAFVLFKQNPDVTSLNFSTESVGTLCVESLADGVIQMSFPNRKPQPVKSIPAELLAGLSFKPDEVLLSEQAYFVVYANQQQVENVEPDLEQLKLLAPYDVVVTAVGDEVDFVSRYFWPANGGAEDPVTGSIHAGLAPMWAEKLNKSKLTAFQASDRGGYLTCEVSSQRVFVSGKAVEYLAGEISI